METNPSLNSLTFTALMVNSAIDDIEGGNISFNDVYDGIEKGTLLSDIAKIFPDTVDFSLIPPGSENELKVINALKSVCEAIKGREDRKSGIENSGLCLIMALLIEVIQQGKWVKD